MKKKTKRARSRRCSDDDAVTFGGMARLRRLMDHIERDQRRAGIADLRDMLATDPATHHLNCDRIAERLYLRGVRVAKETLNG